MANQRVPELPSHDADLLPADICYSIDVSSTAPTYPDGEPKHATWQGVMDALTFAQDVAGTVPAPTLGDATNFLRGDGTWAAAGGGDPLTTKGDLLAHNGAISVRLPVGATDGHALVIDAAEATGVKWAAVAGGGGSPGGADGDIQIGLGSLFVGSDSESATPIEFTLRGQTSSAVGVGGGDLTIQAGGSAVGSTQTSGDLILQPGRVDNHVNNGGSIRLQGTPGAHTFQVVSNTNVHGLFFGWSVDNNQFDYKDGSGNVKMRWGGSVYQVSDGGQFGLNNNVSCRNGVVDVGLARQSAGVAKITDGSTGLGGLRLLLQDGPAGLSSGDLYYDSSDTNRVKYVP